MSSAQILDLRSYDKERPDPAEKYVIDRLGKRWDVDPGMSIAAALRIRKYQKSLADIARRQAAGEELSEDDYNQSFEEMVDLIWIAFARTNTQKTKDDMIGFEIADLEKLTDFLFLQARDSMTESLPEEERKRTPAQRRLERGGLKVS